MSTWQITAGGAVAAAMKCADESEIAPSALAVDGSLYVQCFEAADHVATPRAGSAAIPR